MKDGGVMGWEDNQRNERFGTDGKRWETKGREKIITLSIFSFAKVSYASIS